MRCPTCRYDLDAWTTQDLRTTAKAAPHLARAVLDGRPELVDLLASAQSPAADRASVHAAVHALHVAGRARHAGRALTGEGVVVQLNRSGGGVPKTPVDRVPITFGGLEGDRQDNRRHHGRPWQAVCLWSAEVVDDLAAQGHSIGYGSAGENLTVRGLDWSLLTPGVQLLVGRSLLQVTSYAIPCAKNAQWFSDGGFRRMAQEVSPGRSRVYATVLVEGAVATGDAVTLEPLDLPVQAVPDVQERLFSS